MIVQCLLVLAAALSANAGNILLVFPVPSPSHAIFGNELAKAIVKKGHHVTMITAFPIKEDLQNYTEIVVTELAEFRESKQHVSTTISSYLTKRKRFKPLRVRSQL